MAMSLSTSSAAPDLLAAIVAATRRAVYDRQRTVSAGEIARRRSPWQPRGDVFTMRIGRPTSVNVIAECKRRSPSKGVLCPEYDPVAVARAYEEAGAAAISVLTEPTFFDGSLAHLAAVRRSVETPLLRKDFLVDEYQLYEARLAGADAVLLIMAALRDEQLSHLLTSARNLGLACLVEVHAADERARAVAAGATIIGVNNRNLRTLETDTSVADRLGGGLPDSIVAVAESGLRSADDVRCARRGGYRACLIGEYLITSAAPGARLARLIADAVD